jgi:hypothetical protein
VPIGRTVSANCAVSRWCVSRDGPGRGRFLRAARARGRRTSRQVGADEHERLQLAAAPRREQRVDAADADALHAEPCVFGFLSALMRKSSWNASGGDHEIPASRAPSDRASRRARKISSFGRLRRHDDADAALPCCARCRAGAHGRRDASAHVTA